MVFTTCIVIVFADCFFFVILLVINENRNQVSFYIPDHNASLYLKLFSRLTMFHLYFLIMIDMALLIPSNVCLFVQYKHRHFFISFFLVYTQLYMWKLSRSTMSHLDLLIVMDLILLPSNICIFIHIEA